jgi:hypothetical protein
MELSVRVEVRYLAPARSRLGDVLRLLRSSTWVAFMARHIAPRLEKVSPAETSEVDRLVAQPHVRCDECVICMDADGGEQPQPATQLPCGHTFHRECIQPWLQIQSTCPVCRWQLPKAFAGRYAVRELSSIILLDDDLATVPRRQLPVACVENRYVRTIVTVQLAKVHSLTHEKPCAVNAHMADRRTGEVFSEMEPTHVADCRLPRWKVASALTTHCSPATLTPLPPLVDVLARTDRRKRQIRLHDDGELDYRVVSKRRRHSD